MQNTTAHDFIQLQHEWSQSSNWTHSRCKRNTMRLLVLILYIWKEKINNTHFIITTFPSKCSHESQQLKFFKFIILFSNVLKKYTLIMSFHYEKTMPFQCNLYYFYNVIMSWKWWHTWSIFMKFSSFVNKWSWKIARNLSCAFRKLVYYLYTFIQLHSNLRHAIGFLGTYVWREL